MARGWESKSVESQMEDGKRPVDRVGPKVGAEEQERARKRRGLELSRTRIRNEIATTQSDAHRSTLEKALAFLDEELSGLRENGSESHS